MNNLKNDKIIQLKICTLIHAYCIVFETSGAYRPALDKNEAF